MPIILPDDVDPVKVRLTIPSGRSVSAWVYPTGNGGNEYIMGNALPPGFPGLGDTVRLDDNGSFEILNKVSVTKFVEYNIADCSSNEKWIDVFRQVYDYLNSNDIRVDDAIPGYMAVAVPVEMPADKLTEILRGCPLVILPPEETKG